MADDPATTTDDSRACLTCGACCFSDLPTYVRLDGDDHARLGEASERLTHFVGNRCYLRIEDGRCAALEVRADGTFVCSVYDRRPRTCRALDRGSPACEGERATKGTRPGRELVRVRLAART